MKKTLIIILILFAGLSPLLAGDYYQLFTAAMQFNLAKTVNEHYSDWGYSSSNGSYTNADMIATIGSTDSQYGYVVKITPVDGLYFKTRHDWSSRRPYRLEFVMRGEKMEWKSNGWWGGSWESVHENICTTSINKAPYVGVSDAAGRVNRNWTATTGSGIYPVMPAGSYDSFYLRMPSNDSSVPGYYKSCWIDVILVLPPLESADDMIVTDEYYAEFIVDFYPLDASGNIKAQDPQSFDLMLTGFYDGNTDSPVSDYYQFVISALPSGSYFDFDALKGKSEPVGSIFFSTDTRNSDKWSGGLPTNYEISVGSTPNPFVSDNFFFKRVGTEDRQNTPANSIYYSVDIVPDSSVPGSTYSSGTSTKPIVNNRVGISGGEGYAERKVQVPVVTTGNNNYGPLFGAVYHGTVNVKVDADDVEELQAGVYRSTLYVHLVSTT